MNSPKVGTDSIIINTSELIFFLKGKVATNKFGAFSLSFSIPDTAALGTGYISFKPPDAQINAILSHPYVFHDVLFDNE